ncbi:MAG: metallophosphoesterase family protein [Asticcacaulis sp.]|uniref:metallophosphoesterase family protein n=1 Tax=Asticcacaulis sp. TaxID=1872648 RepID=UPI003F7C8542
MKIAQISDLHFGSLNPVVKDALLRALTTDAPDLILVSGDLTQSALESEFAEAAGFLAQLPSPHLCIPGNHDLPGMDLSRFLDPWARYRRHIADDLNPEWRAGLVHFKALNSARRVLPHWNWANGAISQRQCADVAAAFSGTSAPWRIVALHHPPAPTTAINLPVVLYGREALFRTLSEQRVDLVLAGHQHHAQIEAREEGGHITVFVNAATATSTRLRHQPNGYNRLSFTEDAVRIDLLSYQDGAFSVFETVTHAKSR